MKLIKKLFIFILCIIMIPFSCNAENTKTNDSVSIDYVENMIYQELVG